MKVAVFFLLGIVTYALDATGVTLSGDSPELYFNQPDHPFLISLSSSMLSLASCMEYEESENVFLNLEKIKGENSLEIDKSLSLDGVRQWNLHSSEDFSKPKGWSDNSNSECNGIVMLGGYCQFSNIEVSKTFSDLPSHSQVKIISSFHFIDAWIGEAAYLKVSLEGEFQYVWTESYKAGQASSGINVCGAHHAEGKFVTGIEVIIPHSDDQLRVIFGAMLDEDPCDESWGVSGFQIYLR